MQIWKAPIHTNEVNQQAELFSSLSALTNITLKIKCLSAYTDMVANI